MFHCKHCECYKLKENKVNERYGMGPMLHKVEMHDDAINMNKRANNRAQDPGREQMVKA